MVVCPLVACGKVEIEEERNLLIENYEDRAATFLEFTKTVNKRVKL